MPTDVATRRAPAPTRVPVDERPRLRVVGPPTRRRTRSSLRPTVAIALALIVGSLLAVAVAQAYMTQQQVRLAQVQARLTTQTGEHRDRELRVAQLANPSHIVNQAQQQGLAVPNQVTDLPQVTTPPTDHQRRSSNATAPARHGPRARAPGDGGK